LPKLDELGLAPIMMVTPNTPKQRIERIAKASRGMLYVVSRMGVTGQATKWGQTFENYIASIRQLTELPLAVGFGVRSVNDLKALSGKAEVAALCSQYIEWQRDLGSNAAAKKMEIMLTQANG
jgi:tryptophan synthase alpha chain